MPKSLNWFDESLLCFGFDNLYPTLNCWPNNSIVIKCLCPVYQLYSPCSTRPVTANQFFTTLLQCLFGARCHGNTQTGGCRIGTPAGTSYWYTCWLSWGLVVLLLVHLVLHIGTPAYSALIPRIGTPALCYCSTCWTVGTSVSKVLVPVYCGTNSHLLLKFPPGLFTILNQILLCNAFFRAFHCACLCIPNECSQLHLRYCEDSCMTVLQMKWISFIANLTRTVLKKLCVPISRILIVEWSIKWYFSKVSISNSNSPHFHITHTYIAFCFIIFCIYLYFVSCCSYCCITCSTDVSLECLQRYCTESAEPLQFACNFLLAWPFYIAMQFGPWFCAWLQVAVLLCFVFHFICPRYVQCVLL